MRRPRPAPQALLFFQHSAPRDDDSDPWWLYPFGPFDHGAELLARLRRQVHLQ